ncbi:hypothetical protein IMM1_35040 [Pseudocoprococcus immobilis]
MGSIIRFDFKNNEAGGFRNDNTGQISQCLRRLSDNRRINCIVRKVGKNRSEADNFFRGCKITAGAAQGIFQRRQDHSIGTDYLLTVQAHSVVKGFG